MAHSLHVVQFGHLLCETLTKIQNHHTSHELNDRPRDDACVMKNAMKKKVIAKYILKDFPKGVELNAYLIGPSFRVWESLEPLLQLINYVRVQGLDRVT